MTSIWSFLLQTLSVTLVAGLLLLLKHLFTHQLSPRWQYGIWGLLAVRILLPAGMERGVLLPRLPMWMEVCKTSVEQYLSSAYASSYAPISLTFRETEDADSYTYLSVKVVKTQAGYRISAYGLDK